MIKQITKVKTSEGSINNHCVKCGGLVLHYYKSFNSEVSVLGIFSDFTNTGVLHGTVRSN